MVAIATHRITLPKRISNHVAKRARRHNISFSKTVADMIAEAIEYAEEGHIWEEALRSKAESAGRFVPHEEAWK